MEPSRSRRWIVPALLATAALTTVLLHDDIPGLSGSRDRKISATPSNGATKDGVSDRAADSAGGENTDGVAGATKSSERSDTTVAGQDKKAAPVPGGVAALFDRTFKLKQGGREANWAIALDEISVIDADGKEHVHRLEPAATPDTYEQRLAEFEGEGRVLPVVYPEGEDRNEGNRLLVTKDMMVEVPAGLDRAAVVGSLDFPAKALPTWAPHLALVTADSPLAALASIDGLRKEKDVASAQVMLAFQMSKRAMPNDPLVNNQWHLKYNSATNVVQGTDINVESVWNYPETTNVTRGTGVLVGIVDDGLQTNHPDFVGNINTAIDYDFNGNDADPSPGANDDHGTACGGDVAARGNNGVGVCGSAPEATLVGLRLIAGPISDFDIADAIAHESQAIHVKSNSWGPTDYLLLKMGPDAFEQAALVDSATNGRGGKGTVYLWAGGNGFDYGDNSNYDGFSNSIYAIGVGAMDSLMRRSYYSERGANLLVTAPSNGQSPARGKTTTDRTGSNGYSSGDYTDTFGGTSSATPTTSGIVALMLQKNPALSYRDVQEILATTAKKINPSDLGWVTNSAGFHFHHEYGAGLVDAAAAVTAAGTWTLLGPSVSEPHQTTGGTIPESDANGLVRTFDLSNSEVRIEHVTVSVTIDHSARGNLEITLTSPSGVVSNLAEVHGDSADDYNWTFMTTHNWGERSTGTWTLKIADRSTMSNTSGGTLQSAVLTVQGTVAPPLNPAPLVQITSPANGAVFSPGSTVTVDVNATDLDQAGNAGTVAKVELFDNDVLVDTDTTEPYSFQISPTDGEHELIARATDSEATPGVADSATVNIVMENSPPVITAASIGVSPAYADVALAVSGIVATDPDGDMPTFSYLWQKSSDGRNYTDASGMTSATLPAAAQNAGLLWRCKVTPSDGDDQGTPFLTNIVNIVDRPQTLAAPGTAYSYQSGLVLKNNGNPITRDAIINEFSQGPMANGVSGFSEWVEILTLRTADLRNWSLKESSGHRLTFQNAAVWNNIPAGTRIIIYVGGLTKDSLLPADDTNAADRTLVIPSTNATYFTQSPTSVWPPLANSGDVLSLRNAADQMVSEIGYGLSSEGFINIGEVDDGQSAYFTGDSDEGSNLADNWLPTSSMISRNDISPMAAGDIFMSEYINGTAAGDKGIELYNPTSSPVNLATAGYKLQIYPNGLSSPTLNLSLTGTIPAGGTFLVRKNTASFSAPGREQTSNSADFTWTGDDVIILRKNTTTAVDSIGEIGVDPGAGWPTAAANTSNRSMRRNANILTGDADPDDAYTTPLGEWTFFTQSDFSNVGKHETNPKHFGLGATPTTFAETAGAGASTGTITLAQAAAANVVFTLNSSETDTVTVPATATILAGQTSVTFPINAINDTISDGTQNVTVEVSATGYQNASIALTITDDEVSIVGVTPGKGNNAANTEWIAALVAGTEDAPSVFRLATGSTLPTGLTLNPTTGLISGTVDGAATGTFNVVIERYNVDGDLTSQSFTLTIGTEITYASWITGFPGLSSTAPGDDPESDGLKNLVEFYLGLNPGTMNSGAITTERTASTLSITFRRAKGVGGVTGGAQWSDDLGETWSSTGVTEEILENNTNDQLVKASVAINGADSKKFIRLNVTQTF